MKKKTIDITEYAGKILEALPKGVLLTTKAGEEVNTMIIGWGALGTNWGEDSMIVYVRESRHTKAMLEKNPEFTVNIPAGDIDPEILAVCGSESGRDVNKIEKLRLTLTEPEEVSVPGIKELPITLECRVLYSQEQDPAELDEAICGRFYPADESGRADAHTTYYAQIVAAYVIE
jgi:flavin reductase (DIM6/NTAB) family NADH-FMN oxidoreductase RutF